MGLLDNWYNKEPKNEIDRKTPKKEGLALFFSVLWREFWEICKLNIIMVVFCLPIVTIPTTLTAVNKILMFMIMDRSVYTFEDFLLTFKREWKRSSLIGLIYFPLLILTMFGMYFYSIVYNNFFLYTFSMLGCAVVLMVGFYLFAMLGVIELDLKETFRNAILLAFLRIPQSVLTLIAMVVLSVLVILFLPSSILTVLLLYFALIVYMAVFCAYTGLSKFVMKEEE